MEKHDIIDGKIGEFGGYDVEFKDHALVAKVEVKHDLGSAAFEVKIEAKAVLAAIKKAIPGDVDDAILGVLEAALLK